MKKLSNKWVYLFVATVVMLACIIYFISKPDGSSKYIQKLNNSFSAEFDGLNAIFVESGFALGALHQATCTVGSPNSGLEGLLICDTSRNASLLASETQISNWSQASKRIDDYLEKQGWKYSTGNRTDVTYSKLDSIFTSSKATGLITIYEKRFPEITCKLVFDTNREYPHQQVNKVDVSESCEKNL